MGSQPQNPEFRKDLEIFHPCFLNTEYYYRTLGSNKFFLV